MRFIATNNGLVSRFTAVASAILAIGVVTACAPSGGESAAAATTVTATTTAVTLSTVTSAATETVSAAPVTVTVTESAAPAATNSGAPEAPTGGGAAGPFTDGLYLIGVDIQAGNYRCTAPSSDGSYWRVADQGNNLVDGGFAEIAFVNGGYSVEFKYCDGQWERIGG